MMDKSKDHGETHGKSEDSDHTCTSAKRSGVDWADPSVPVGDAPPLPYWPLALAGIAWSSWGVFLVVMLLSRWT